MRAARRLLHAPGGGPSLRTTHRDLSGFSPRASISMPSPKPNSSCICRRSVWVSRSRVYRNSKVGRRARSSASSQARDRSLSGGRTCHEAEFECLFGIERLARKKEIAPSIHTQQQWVDNVHSIARHYVGREVSRILKLGGIRGQHDVAEKGDLGMAPGWTVDGADDRYLNFEQLH